MFRIDSPTAAGALPAPLAAGAPGFFRHADPASGDIPTIVTSDWCNGIQEEIANVIGAAAIGLDKTDNTQLLQAIREIIDGGDAGSGAGSIFGLSTSNTPGSATTSISIAVGQGRDSTNTKNIILAAPIAKSLTALWAPGNTAGGRDAGALANGQTWHLFLIDNPTTGAVDALFSQSPTAPTLPAGFSKFRRIASILLDVAATTIRQYNQTGDLFEYKTRSTDYAAQANGGGPFLRKIGVPAGIPVTAECYFQSTGTVGSYLSGLYNPAFGPPPAFGVPSQWAQIRRVGFEDQTGTPNSYETVVAKVLTDNNQQIYTYSSDPSDVIVVGVLRYTDHRGRLS